MAMLRATLERLGVEHAQAGHAPRRALHRGDAIVDLGMMMVRGRLQRDRQP
jgi:hypothetical protein